MIRKLDKVYKIVVFRYWIRGRVILIYEKREINEGYFVIVLVVFLEVYRRLKSREGYFE